jgi:pyrroline-5-carboxylate reductase
VKSKAPVHADKILVSVLAGTSLETLKCKFGFLGINIVRSMPNTPMQVGAGCTLYAENFSSEAPESVLALYERVKLIFNLLGQAYKVEENKIDSYTALSGCTPAFVYQIIEALSDGGVKQGIPRDIAIRMAAQTVLGAAKMVLETGKHPAELKDEVCSPGGATIAGVHELEKGSLRATLMNALEGATQRIKQMKME